MSWESSTNRADTAAFWSVASVPTPLYAHSLANEDASSVATDHWLMSGGLATQSIQSFSARLREKRMKDGWGADNDDGEKREENEFEQEQDREKREEHVKLW